MKKIFVKIQVICSHILSKMLPRMSSFGDSLLGAIHQFQDQNDRAWEANSRETSGVGIELESKAEYPLFWQVVVNF